MDRSSPSPRDESSSTVLVSEGVAMMAEAIVPVWARQLDLIHAQLNHGIGELTSAIASLCALQDRLTALGDAPPSTVQQALAECLPDMQAHTEQALTGLQIGDRLSQMMGVVRGDMQRLIDEMPLIGEPGAQLAQAWLDELRSKYTTVEQHRVHDGEAPEAVVKPALNIDFF